MVAIMVAALLGAGFSTLWLAQFGPWAVLAGIPLTGSTAALGCAAVIFVSRSRDKAALSVKEQPFEKPLPLV